MKQAGFDFAEETFVPDWKKASRFGGKTFDQKLDGPRLNKQCQSVFDLMKDGRWRSLAEIARVTGNPEASVSARLRDFRKPQFGNWNVERRRLDHGLHEYRVVSR